MRFKILFSLESEEQYNDLCKNSSKEKQRKAVQKALSYLAVNPKHPSLNTHKFQSFKTYEDDEIFEAYAENKTPGAYRIFWHYGPEKGEITVVAITPHT